MPSANGSPSVACARPLSKLSTTGRIFSIISFAPMIYMLDFSFSVRLRKLSNSAMFRFKRSVRSSICCSSLLSFFFLPKKDVFPFDSFSSAASASFSPSGFSPAVASGDSSTIFIFLNTSSSSTLRVFRLFTTFS